MSQLCNLGGSPSNTVYTHYSAPVLEAFSKSNQTPVFHQRDRYGPLRGVNFAALMVGSKWKRENSLTKANRWKLLKNTSSVFPSEERWEDGNSQLVNRLFLGSGLPETIKQITSFCEVCQKNNPLSH